MNNKLKKKLFVLICYIATLITLISLILGPITLYMGFDVTQKSADTGIFFSFTIATIIFYFFGDTLTKWICFSLAPNIYQEEVWETSFDKNEIVTLIYSLYFLVIITTNFLKIHYDIGTTFEAIISAFAVFASLEKIIDKYKKISKP